MSNFGEDLIQSLNEALVHAKGESPATVHAPVDPREVRIHRLTASGTGCQASDMKARTPSSIDRDLPRKKYHSPDRSIRLWVGLPGCRVFPVTPRKRAVSSRGVPQSGP